jgi:hypothetical protein
VPRLSCVEQPHWVSSFLFPVLLCLPYVIAVTLLLLLLLLLLLDVLTVA